MLHATVVDESMMWAGGWGAEFSLLLNWDYSWTGQHPPVGGSELENETYRGAGTIMADAPWGYLNSGNDGGTTT